MSQPRGQGPLRVCGAEMAYAPHLQHHNMPRVWPKIWEGCNLLEKLPNLSLMVIVRLPGAHPPSFFKGTDIGLRFGRIPSSLRGSFVFFQYLYLLTSEPVGGTVLQAEISLDDSGGPIEPDSIDNHWNHPPRFGRVLLQSCWRADPPWAQARVRGIAPSPAGL